MLILEKFSILKTGCISLFGPLKQILLDLNNFFDLHTNRKTYQEQFLFWEYGLVQFQ
jgi:hypothetical protein